MTADDTVALVVHSAVGAPVDVWIVEAGEKHSVSHDTVTVEVLPRAEAEDRKAEIEAGIAERKRKLEERKREIEDRDVEPGAAGGGGGGGVIAFNEESYGRIEGSGGGSDE